MNHIQPRFLENSNSATNSKTLWVFYNHTNDGHGLVHTKEWNYIRTQARVQMFDCENNKVPAHFEVGLRTMRTRTTTCWHDGSSNEYTPLNPV